MMQAQADWRTIFDPHTQHNPYFTSADYLSDRGQAMSQEMQAWKNARDADNAQAPSYNEDWYGRMGLGNGSITVDDGAKDWSKVYDMPTVRGREITSNGNDFMQLQAVDRSGKAVGNTIYDQIERHGYGMEFLRLALPVITAGAAGIIGAGAGAAAGAGATSTGQAIGQSLGMTGQTANTVGNAVYGGLTSLGTGADPLKSMLGGAAGGLASGAGNWAGNAVGSQFGNTAGSIARGAVQGATSSGLNGLINQGRINPMGLLAGGLTGGIGSGVSAAVNPMAGNLASQIARNYFGGLLAQRQQRPTSRIPQQGLLGTRR